MSTNRIDGKRMTPAGLVLKDEERAHGVIAEVPESYQSQIKTRSEQQTSAAVEDLATHVLPAWIKTQVAELEMRRKARHMAAKPELSTPRTID